MPARVSDAGARIGANRGAVCADGSRPFDNQAPGRVIKTQEIELAARRSVEHIREGHRRWRAKGGDSRRLHRDIEGVLQDPWRQHVPDDIRRDGAEAHLTAA